MADPKKTDKKKPEASASTSSNTALWEIIGVLLALMIIGSAIANFSVLSFLTSSGESDNQNPSQKITGDYDFWGNVVGSSENNSLLSSGDLKVGTDVLSKGLVQVRREPAGSVIGLQKRGAGAKIVDGPINAYGTVWWMVDYEDPPSGWVEEKYITSEFFGFYVFNFFPILWGYIKMLGYALSVFFGLAIAYYAIREMYVPTYYPESDIKINNKEIVLERKNSELTKTQVAPNNLPTGLPTGEVVEPFEENTRWEHVELLLKSHNSSDWRQAIIEADVMLEEMLDKMGYPGVSIGDKLKNIEKSEFETLDKAWEAHKVRNRIAHDGVIYKLPYDEVTRVIGLYRAVFKEFYWI